MPQPSKTHGETVCCAGVTTDKNWKRLFPIRFRHLSGETSFSRWDWIQFSYRRPTADNRPESCHVYSDTIEVLDKLPDRERSRFLAPLLVGSANEAASRGQSLALIRPRKARFFWKRKKNEDIEAEKDAFRFAARQTSLFDEELAAIEPTPYEFRFQFEDDAGRHNYQNGDWEAHAMFWREAHRTNAKQALEWMDEVFNTRYPRAGMAFALGNMAKRPQTWQLLGVLRLDVIAQGELF